MGRGSSKVGNGNTFRSEADLEKALTGFDDPRLKEYSDANSEESRYNNTMKSNLNRSIDEDGYDARIIDAEEAATKRELRAMPKLKTPRQLGEEKALKERLNILEELRKRKGEKGRGRGAIEMVVERRR